MVMARVLFVGSLSHGYGNTTTTTGYAPLTRISWRAVGTTSSLFVAALRRGGASRARRPGWVRMNKATPKSSAVEEAKDALDSAVDSAKAKVGQVFGTESYSLACPKCKSVEGLEEMSSFRGALLCVECGETFGAYMRNAPDVRDFVLGGQSQTQQKSSTAARLLDTVESVVNRALAPPPFRQELFRNPIVSFLYERGWRDNFAQAGFPGPDEELVLALDWFREASSILKKSERLGGTVLDISCGSGLMTRRLVQSKQFDRVVAVDYSESMLRETVRRARGAGLTAMATSNKGGTTIQSELRFVRADVAKLPFAEGAVSFIHNGAALHCYPVIQDAVREFYRVLKPGGAVFATTFLRKGAYARMPRGNGSMRIFELDEVKYLFIAGGFQDVQVEATRGCAIIRALKC